jgi:iron complex outermembrane receptor protein
VPEARLAPGAATGLEEIVVTGSYLTGSARDTALPIDTVTSEDLLQQGSPSLIQLVKTLPAAASSIGESNRFLGDVAGVANINLRGFGPARTLVLMNGRRLTPSTEVYVGGYNLNFIPDAAIDRIEVLKQGAAATYGSDAVAGVVNFITRKDLIGLEAKGNYTAIPGSDGDYSASLAWGWQGDRTSTFLSADYKRRSQLKTTDRAWALLPITENPYGGWSSASNPGGYTTGNGGAILPNGSLSHPFTSPRNFQDDGCVELGGTIVGGTCRFNYTAFDNLVNDEYHSKLYGELNTELTDDVNFHLEAMWSRIDVPNERIGPSNGTLAFPTPIQPSGGFTLGGGLSPYPAEGLSEQSRFYIPLANPGLTALYNAHCAGAPASPYSSEVCGDIANYGATAGQRSWRPWGYGGNPNFSDGTAHYSRISSAYRIAANLDGSLDVPGGLKWNIGLTYMNETADRTDPDLGVNRIQLALRGFGGPSCDVTAAVANNTPGQNGCLWFNPFANGTPTSATTGASNPLYRPTANTNTAELAKWMEKYLSADYENSILVGDIVTSGSIPNVELSGGAIEWALGGQIRSDSSAIKSDKLYSTNCVDGVDNPFPHGDCKLGTGSTIRAILVEPFDVSRNVSAIFTELKFPITDDLVVSGALRSEFFGGEIGSTTNPKLDAHWQLLPWFAMRASYGTTFRAPPQNTVQPGITRGSAPFTDPVTGVTNYRPASMINNPLLQPETSTNYSVGGIVQTGGFMATLDYWLYDFKDELTIETPGAIYLTLFPSANASTWQCGNASLVNRFSFAEGAGASLNPITGTNCHPSNLQGMTYNRINGPAVKTDGLDFALTYQRPDTFAGDLTVGGDASYIFSYERSALLTTEGIQIGAPIDRAGKIEQLGNFYSLPEVKANAYVNYQYKEHNARLTAHYIGSMTEQLFATEVKSYTAFDFTYGVNINKSVDLMFSVANILDEDPSFVYSQYNYDYGMGNPLGRTFSFGVRVRH